MQVELARNRVEVLRAAILLDDKCCALQVCASHGQTCALCPPECNLSIAVCVHDKQWKSCTACGPCGLQAWRSPCEHGKRRSVCPVPACGGGGGLCEHGKPRSLCPVPACGGGGELCEHGKRRSLCPVPACGGGGGLCEHGKRRSRCPVPACGGGGGLCEHEKRKDGCALCNLLKKTVVQQQQALAEAVKLQLTYESAIATWGHLTFEEQVAAGCSMGQQMLLGKARAGLEQVRAKVAFLQAAQNGGT